MTSPDVPMLSTSTPAILIKLAMWEPDHDHELPRHGFGYREGMTATELVDSTRAWWYLSQPRAAGYSYAVAVHAGITRGVWRIEPGSWRRASPATAKRLGLSPRRFAFRATPAPICIHEAFVGAIGRRVPTAGVFGSGSVIAY